MKKTLLFLAVSALTFNACKDSEKDPDPIPAPSSIIVEVTGIEGLEDTGIDQVKAVVSSEYLSESLVLATAEVKNRSFKLEIPAVKDTYLENAEEYFQDGSPSAVVSDRSAKVSHAVIFEAFASGDCVGEFMCGEDHEGVDYIYADRNVNVTSENPVYDIKLTRGWNKIYVRYSSVSSPSLTTDLPSDIGGWSFYEYNFD